MSKSIHVGLAHSLIALEAMSEEEQNLVKEIKSEIQLASGAKKKKRKYTKRVKAEVVETPPPAPKKVVKKAPVKKAPVKKVAPKKIIIRKGVDPMTRVVEVDEEGDE